MLNQFLLLAAILFASGVYGVIARKNTVMVLMSIELILNAVNINLLTFGAANADVAGAVFALFVIAVAAAEVGVGLAMVLIIYRNRHSVDLDEVDSMGMAQRARAGLDHPRLPAVSFFLILLFGKRLRARAASSASPPWASRSCWRS